MTEYRMSYADMKPLSAEEIEKGRIKTPESNYPPLENRLVIPAATLAAMIQNRHIVIPDEGPHSINNHPNRNKPEKWHDMHPIATEENPMGPEWAAYWHSLGLLTDTADRPLHPRAWQLLTHPDVGMFTGPGFHYRYGPGYMGNLVLRRLRGQTAEYAMVKTKRGNAEKWSVPGGYDNEGESPETIAFREGFEEAGIMAGMLGRFTMRTVFSPPRGFKRDTLHAWGEEWFTAPMSHDNPALEGVELVMNAQSEDGVKEVLDVAWVDREVIANPPADFDIMSTHQRIILGHEAFLAAQTGSSY